MTVKYEETKVFIIYSLSVISLLFYLYGFFPVDRSYSTSNIEQSEFFRDKGYGPGDKLFDKLVLVVIDALRYDFVIPKHGNPYMPFTTSTIYSNHSCLIKVKAKAPTVTMPRLKAMTSGSVPTYFDVISNFMSSQLKHDSFLQQAKNENFKMVFYGDDTWLKLFPNVFIRSEGTNSFFASDFTEVDTNVTRHLDEEFEKTDWNFMILHYLGLDHIGHIEGPRSVFVRPKLEEMDSVILKIFNYLKKFEEDGMKSMFLVTSDHGMKDSGGHGGVTEPEIMLPLVSIGKSCNYIEGWPSHYTAEQTDIAPTISKAFGLAVPNCSIGKLIPALLHGVSPAYIFKSLQWNEKMLRQKVALLGDSKIPLHDRQLRGEVTEESVHNLYRALSEMSLRLQSVSEFNHPVLIVSLLFMWISATVLSYMMLQRLSDPSGIAQIILLIGTALYGISFVSTSFIEEEHQTWYFLWVTICLSAELDILRRAKAVTFKVAVPWFALIIMHRVMRKLNQTGDKWASLPDIKSYVESHHLTLVLLYLAGLSALFWCAYNVRCTRHQMAIFGVALITNFCYRLAVSSIHIDFLSFYPKSRGKWESVIYWILTFIFGYRCIRTKKPIYLTWSLIASILLKPHSVILTPLQIIASQCIKNLYNKSEDELWNGIAHVWLGYVFYFYQGNGNSLANVDVSAGFVGLEEYSPLYSFVLIAAHTNTSHVLSFLLSPKRSLAISTLRIISLTLYCTFLMFQLNHLFIWSVFSPKLLYETNYCIIVFLLIFLNWIINY